MPCAKCHKLFKRGDTIFRNPLLDEDVLDVSSAGEGELVAETELISLENLHLECAWKDKSLRPTLKLLGLKPTKKRKTKP